MNHLDIILIPFNVSALVVTIEITLFIRPNNKRPSNGCKTKEN